MMNIHKETSVASGYVHALCFSGSAPDWDTIRAIAYEGASHPDLVDAQMFKNGLTDYAVACAAGLWVDQYVKTPSKIVLGTGQPPQGQTDVNSADTELWQADPTTARTVDIKTVFLTYYSEFGYTYQTTEANDTDYTEAGLTDEDGNLWAHVRLQLRKSTAQTAVILWKVYHQGV